MAGVVGVLAGTLGTALLLPRSEPTPPPTVQRFSLLLPASTERGGFALSPDGRWLLTGGRDGMLRIWDAATGELRQEWRAHDYLFDAAVFSPDGKVIATGKPADVVSAFAGENLEAVFLKIAREKKP